ncbi:hypothetical protein DMN91_005519 [Ooceraea biroi]|uniref:Endonuclease/exonuclease/phosphatase domain-containing protein n=1 Tax=Ooceraea biroi TaxID=2015173 RepID=A0A3L8DLE8_OOCBI|nr:hypothetical protein DMN91_005519 [Ooceraea biroi]
MTEAAVRDSSLPTTDDLTDDCAASRHGIGSQVLSSSLLEEGDRISVLRINALKRSIGRHNDNVAKILLGSRDTLDKRQSVESAFRACKEAFFEISSAYINLLDERQVCQNFLKLDDIKRVVEDALGGLGTGCSLDMQNDKDRIKSGARSFASVVKSSAAKVQLSRGPSISIPKTTSFLIVPDGENSKCETSKDTLLEVQKVIKPSLVSLRVNRITTARNNGVRIEALDPDIDRIRNAPELSKAGFRVQMVDRLNPRIIVHGIPTNLSDEEVCEEVRELNLRNLQDPSLKVVYTFPSKNRRHTSCVIEVSPEVRNELKKESRIFICYSACSLIMLEHCSASDVLVLGTFQPTVKRELLVYTALGVMTLESIVFFGARYHIICISELWLRPEICDDIVALPGYRLFRGDRVGRRGGGVAFYLRSSLTARVLGSSDPLYCGKPEFLIAKITAESGTRLLLAVVYRPPHCEYLAEFFDVFADMSALYKHAIIFGDFNADLGTLTYDSRQIFDYVERYNLHLVPFEATHHTRDSATWLDICLADDCDRVVAYGQHDVNFLSAHDLIYITYKIGVMREKRRTILATDFRGFETADFLRDLEALN